MAGSRHNQAILAAAALSLLIHGGMGVVASRMHVGAENRRPAPGPAPAELVLIDEPEPPPPTPPPQPPESEVAVGVEKSDAKTKTWIGFDSPFEHTATMSVVEQPALDPEAGMPNVVPATMPTNAPPVDQPPKPDPLAPQNPSPTPPSPPPADSPPTPADHPTPTPDRVPPSQLTPPDKTPPPAQEPLPPHPNPPAATAPTPAPPVDLPEPKSPEFVGPPLPDDYSAEDPEPQSKPDVKPEKPVAPADAAKPNKPEPTTTKQPSPPAPPPTPAAAPSGIPADKDPRQSDPSALKSSVVIRPGRVAAAQGLEIVTRRPEFTRLTRVTTFPGDPVLGVTFDRWGRVSQVKLIKSSGALDVDEPVVNAVYKWTAKGKALNELPPNDPKAGVTLTVTVLLR